MNTFTEKYENIDIKTVDGVDMYDGRRNHGDVEKLNSQDGR